MKAKKMNQFLLLAKYNKWMNDSFYQKCKELGQEAVEKDQGIFFDSIIRTLNHLLVSDIFWLSNCTDDRSFYKLHDKKGERLRITEFAPVLFKDIDELWGHRERIDNEIIKYIDSLPGDALQTEIEYLTPNGKDKSSLVVVLTHWFNHQTHHRGQVSALFSQQEVDYGLTDVIFIKGQL